MICPKPFRGLLIDGFEIFWTNAGIFCWRTRHPLMTWSGRILAIFDRSTTLSAGMLYRCFTSKNLHQKMLINCYNLPNLRWKLHISGNHQLDQLIPSSCTLVNPQRGLQNHRKWKLFGQLQLCDSHSHLCLQTPSGIVWPQVQEGETKSANRDNWSIILLVLGRACGNEQIFSWFSELDHSPLLSTSNLRSCLRTHHFRPEITHCWKLMAPEWQMMVVFANSPQTNRFFRILNHQTAFRGVVQYWGGPKLIQGFKTSCSLQWQHQLL